MREKLIELLDDALLSVSWDSHDYPDTESATDILIANDVVPVVRCKDCKNRDEITKECKHPKAVGWDVIIPEDNDFCSYGERKDNG